MFCRFLLASLVFVILLGTGYSSNAAQMQSSWNSYFGAAAGDMLKTFKWTTYLDTNDNPIAWAQTLRHIVWIARDPQLFVNYRLPVLDNDSEFKTFLEQVKSVVKKRDIIIHVGSRLVGFGEQHINKYMDMVRKDRGELWKKFVYDYAIRVASVPGGAERISWEIDNEINSTGYTNAIREWAGQGITSSKSEKFYANDRSIISLYFEFVFAPTVEALRSASLKLFGTENKIKILPGTIAGGFMPESIRWLDDFLSYEIRGDYAKSLAGKKVYELVDLVSIHYLVTWDDDSWSNVLDGLYTKWVGKGRIRGIWATEEGGKWMALHGRGASTALKVTARYLHYWAHRSLTPEQGRCLFWGWRIGTPETTGEEAMKVLYGFLGDAKLEELDNSVEVLPKSNIESYLFRSINGKKKCFCVLFPKNATDTIRLRQLNLHGLSWDKGVSAKVLIFGVKGTSSLIPNINRNLESYSVTFHQDVVLSDQTAVLLVIDQKG